MIRPPRYWKPRLMSSTYVTRIQPVSDLNRLHFCWSWLRHRIVLFPNKGRVHFRWYSDSSIVPLTGVVSRPTKLKYRGRKVVLWRYEVGLSCVLVNLDNRSWFVCQVDYRTFCVLLFVLQTTCVSGEGLWQNDLPCSVTHLLHRESQS